MRDQRITAIILAATEMGGMGNDYFECKTRHLLPIADKTLIQHLIETVDKLEDVRTNYTIILEEKVDKNEKKKPCEDVYKSLFKNRIDDDIKLVGQKPLTQGTFEAVRGCIEGKDKKEDVFPILVLYGDTLVEEKFLKRIVNEVARNKGESRVVWGLIKSKKEKSDVYCVKRKYPEDEDGFSTISEEDIFDIFEYPLEENNYLYLHDTGIMVISESAWNDINKLIDRIHRPSSFGLFSFTNLIKQALVFKNVDVKEIGDVYSAPAKIAPFYRQTLRAYLYRVSHPLV